MIGRAAAAALVRDGWEVVALSRSGEVSAELAALGVRGAAADRADDAQLRAAIGDSVDVVVDMVAYTGEHGEQLNGLSDVAGSLVVISSASVYADAEGRALDGVSDPPQMPVPVLESQPTVEPGDETYSTRKVALEQALLAGPLPATLLRACAIHGPGAKLPRELYFAKRAYDGRQLVAIAFRGESRFHTTSVPNLAELIRLAAAQPGDRAFNAGDPDPSTTLEICRAVGAAMGHEFEPVLLPGDEYDNPWGAPPEYPFVISMEAAERELGYRSVATYPEAVRETCAWLVEELDAGRDWNGTYLEGMVDYAKEDEVLGSIA
jgi:nucleoside-diphosphate-sugar epimerase